MDDADKATQLQADLNRSAARHRRPESGLEPVGWCRSCGEDVGPKQIFCNSTCADQQDRRERQRRQR